MTRTHQLETSLRSLSLSGMLDTLEARLAQAHAGELGHLEFLQVLCEDEVSRRDAAALTRRVRAARFESASTLEEFDFSFNPKVPTAQIRDLATLGFVEAGESVILHGPVGVGKSHVAQALGHQACRRGYSVAFTKTSRLLADLAGGHADRSWDARLKRWARPAVLILDLSRPRDYPDRDWASGAGQRFHRRSSLVEVGIIPVLGEPSGVGARRSAEEERWASSHGHWAKGPLSRSQQGSGTRYWRSAIRRLRWSTTWL